MNLRKELTLFSVYCIATGAMISSGLFILPGLAHAKAGDAEVFSYLLAGVFALVGMVAFASLFLDVDIRLLGVGLTTIFVVINVTGIKEAGTFQAILVTALLAILGFYVVKGIPQLDIRNFEPFAPYGLAGILSTAGYVFISYGGLLKVASIAEETKNPSRTVPLAMIFSLLTVTVIYTTVIFITAGVLPDDILDKSLTPISDGANAIMGRPGALILGIAAMLAFISTANAGIMAASRYPLALARDNLLPEQFGMINKRFGTPAMSILLTGVVIIIFLFIKLDFLVKVASTVLILTFIFSCMSVIIMRESGVQNYQPKFIVPMYPWLQILGIMLYTFLIFEMGREAVIAGFALVSGGLFIYWFYGKVRSSKEYALLHLIQRITAKELTTRDLESELKEIIRGRDEITGDRFDSIIEKCAVIDIPESISLEEFFRRASEKLAPRLSIDAGTIHTLLRNREEENSTIIAPGLAIPHIIIEGEKKFDILLVRCKQGIVFSESFNDIKTAFILAGTRDERNFHLQALSAIAQIVHDHKFPQRWLGATDIEGLRDVILLGRRKRV